MQQNTDASEYNSLKNLSIGIIGMGWVGKTYAKNLELRGFDTICYSLEPPYVNNKYKIKECDVVMIAVPTPTNQGGADYTILKEVLLLVGKRKIAVIKSTILPGTTNALQNENPEITIIHSPEFLSMATADEDAANPKRNIFGTPVYNEVFTKAVELLTRLFPPSPYTIHCTAIEAEIIKYSHNIGGYIRIVFHNLLYDISSKMGADWENIKTAIAADPNNIMAYLNPVHKGGRGAGGPCFIKDFSAFSTFYESFSDKPGYEMLNAIEKKNIDLLYNSNKDLEILKTLFSG